MRTAARTLVFAALCCASAGRAATTPTSAYNTELYDPDEHYVFTHDNVKELVDFGKDAGAVAVSGAQSTVIQRDGRPALKVTGSGAFGVRISKKVDFSAHSVVAVEITNTGDKYLALSGSLRGNGKGQKGGRATMGLFGGQTDLMIFPHYIPRPKLPAHLKEYFGDNVPGLFATQYLFQECRFGDSLSVSISPYAGGTFHEGDVQFTVNRVWAGGRFEDIPKEDLEKRYPKPHLDEFNQWKFYDWPGKVKSKADLEARRADEERDLNANPAPIKLSKYWGWADGPELEGTGHFRVAIHEGKWWFVDPEGYLFLSQGFLQTWAKDSAPMIRRFRSFGINSVAGRSGIGPFVGKMPYCIHIDRNAPIPNEKVRATEITEEIYRPKVRARVEKVLPRLKDDPYCIGVFINNEIAFLNDECADVYFRVNAEEIKRVAPNMLYLGAKSQHATNIAAKYCDVVSTDVLCSSTAPTNKDLYRTGTKPVLMGAFSCGYVGHGMFCGPGLVNGNRRMRAHAYELYCTNGYRNPNAIGFHMYTLRNNHTWGGGVFDRTTGLWDRSMVAAMRRLARSMYQTHMNATTIEELQKKALEESKQEGKGGKRKKKRRQ